MEPRRPRIALKNGNIMATPVVKITKAVRRRSLARVNRTVKFFIMSGNLMV